MAATALTQAQREQFLTEVGHSLNMMAELPVHVGDETLPTCVRTAAIDAYYMHARGLVEFFLSPTSHSVSVTEYVPDWEETTRDHTQLGPLIGDANEQVAHLSAARVADLDGGPGINVHPERLSRYSVLILDVAVRFVDALSAAGSGHESRAREVVAEAAARNAGPGGGTT